MNNEIIDLMLLQEYIKNQACLKNIDLTSTIK